MNMTHLETERRRPHIVLRRLSLSALIALVRAHPLLTALLVTIILLEIVHGIEMLALFPLYLSEVEQESASSIALTISIYLIIDVLWRTPAGWLADRIGRKPLLITGIILSIAPLPLMLQTRDPQLFLLLNGLNGLGAGSIWPSIYASIADTYGAGRRGLIFGLVNTVMLGGLATGPISGNLLIGLTNSFPLAFLFCIALLLGVLAIAVLGVKESKRNSPSPLVRHAPLTEKAKGVTLTAQMAVLFLVVFCLTLGIALLVPVLTLYGKQVLHLTPTQFGLTLALPAVATAIALVPFGLWVDRFGRKWPLVIGMAVFGACLWLTPLSTVPLVVSIGATIGGLGYALAVPAWNALTMDRIPHHARGTLLGIVSALQGIGVAVGPGVGGVLWEQVSPFAPFLAAASAMSFGALLSLLIHET